MKRIERTANKKYFRIKCLERIKKVRQHPNKYKKDKMVIDHLYQMIVANNDRKIMLFLPLKGEVNIVPLIRRLRMQKRELYVPFMEGKSFRVVKYRLPLERKSFGTKEPKDSKQYRDKKIDLAIVPIVGTDITYRRVGFGKGMYDRFFEKEIKNIDKIVFVARYLCYSRDVVTDSHDVTADMLLTPQGISMKKSNTK